MYVNILVLAAKRRVVMDAGLSTRIAFFGHNAQDAAVKRRIGSLQTTGSVVRGYTMRRDAEQPCDWDNVDLGRTYDGAMWQRLSSIAKAFPKLRGHYEELREADIWVARNLDMLILAAVTHRVSGAQAPLVYECLDIHHLMTRSDFVGSAMRAIERRLIRASERIIVSSPGFIREYFDVHHRDQYRASIIENRLPPGSVPDGRPAPGALKSESEPIVIGWYGNLRCRRSMKLLRTIAQRMPDRVRVLLYGNPSLFDLPNFTELVEDLPNLEYRGKYRYPDDLERIYGELDLIWAGDFHDAQFNSRWLLPNRVYEGGYFGVPPVAPEDSETGRWVRSRSSGWTVANPLEDSLIQLLQSLSHEQIHRQRSILLELDRERFVQPEQEMTVFVDQVLNRSPV